VIRRLPVAARIGLAFVLLVVLVGLFAPLLTAHDPTRVSLAPASTGPGGHFWFGVDRLGRDVYSRLVAGTRRSLIVGFGSAGIALVAGTFLGALAGSGRRVVDEVVMRLLDVIMAFPTIVLAAILVVAYGKNNLLVLVVAIAFVFTPQVARVVRANVAAQFSEDYVAAERVIGAGRLDILARHVARNCAAPILVFTTIMVANAIVFEASLSFIGGGLQPEAAASSWGSVIAYGQQLLASHGWWATFFPGMVILATVLALNLLAEGFADVWAAPAPRAADAAVPGPATGNATGSVTPLPGLAEAAARLAERARPVKDTPPVLSVRNLRIAFPHRHSGLDVVAGINLDVRSSEVLGIVGESGSGKSLTALSIMGLAPRGARVSGRIDFAGRDLLTLSAKDRRALLGRRLAMIYQDALSALNPAMTVRTQLGQLIRRGGTHTAEDLMGLVGLDPARTLASYPHQLSGGQRQRVLIAMALSRDPELIIADEPTTALDVTVQAQIMQLLLRLREQLGFAMILVSHDVALVADVADRIAVMYGGQIAETAAVADLLAAPAHHYTRGLLGSVLSLESPTDRLIQIPGVAPTPADFPTGCRFADRCPLADATCRTTVPPHSGTRHQFACHHPADRALAR
jgi:peptide/nickel transport system permease protein